jgi:hypothetical protein
MTTAFSDVRKISPFALWKVGLRACDRRESRVLWTVAMSFATANENPQRAHVNTPILDRKDSPIAPEKSVPLPGRTGHVFLLFAEADRA